MKRILKGFWDCEYCNKKHIDGLIDTCPGCGKQKSENVKYYLDKSSTEVTEEELKNAHILKEECDGKHKDWICPFCQQLNNYSDETCSACGASKNDSEKEYGEEEKILKEDYVQNDKTDYAQTENNIFFQTILTITNKYKFYLIGVFLVSLITFVLWPRTDITTVSGFKWERNIEIEEYQTFNESGWSLPSTARLISTATEFKEYEQVLDHYDTKTRTCSREVLSGYDTHSTYSDNGNGTFTENTYETPRYTTEYYTETYEEPVYRQEAVYDTKYYYEIDRWTIIDSYSSSGTDKKPYWNESYTLKELQRDSNRIEKYYLFYESDSQKTYEELVNFEKWNNKKIGDSIIIKKNLLGIVYSSEDNCITNQN